MSKRRRFSVLISTMAIVGAVCSTSAQAQVSIGELASSPKPYCGGGPFENVPGPGTSLGTYSVPVSGAITSWSTNATAGEGQTLTFKVYRRVDATHYIPVGHDGPRALVANSVNTFKTAIQVEAGDVIGNNDLAHVEEVHNACEFQTGNLSDVILCSEAQEDFPDGTMFGIFPECEQGVRPNETATLLPPPTVGSLKPSSGSIAGGTRVVIRGANFAELKGVTFGAKPAKKFTVDSEGKMTAIAPAGAKLDEVKVAVTTLAGTATSASSFEYQGCEVPKLLGRSLQAARKRARRAGCGIGKVRMRDGAPAGTGKIVKQRPRAGRLLPPGAKVGVTLGR